jgi:hypothetical protein
LMVAGVIMVSASAAFHLAGTRFGSGEPGRLGRMPWRQHSSWSLYLATARWLLTYSASGDHVEELRPVRKTLNIGYDGSAGAR